MSVTRRQFVHGAGVTGAVAAFSAEPAAAQQAGVENVKAHGAVGDGQTDDTAAIRRAANAAAPGGTVHFPAGTYLVGSNGKVGLDYPANGSWRDLTWRGAGADRSIIRMAPGHNGSHFVARLRGNVGETRFEGLTLDGNKDAQGGANSAPGLCLLSEGVGRVVARDCRLTRANNAASKFSGRCDADLRYCRFDRNGYRSNGGHAISPNQTAQTQTVVKWCLFERQGGVDIDIGQMSEGVDWQTVLVERSFFRGSKRGVLKVCAENKRTTVRNSVMVDTGEIPVKMNPTNQHIGTVELDNVLIDRATWPGIDLPCPGRLELTDVAIQNVNTDGQRGGGIYGRGLTVRGSRVSVHNVDGGASPALDLRGCSGRLGELIYGSVSGVGPGAGIVGSARQGAPLTPDVPTAAECGPRGGSGGSGSGRAAPSPAPSQPQGPPEGIDHVVDSPGQFRPTLGEAGVGEAVWLGVDVTISSTVRVPPGVTLASNGATIRVDAQVTAIRAGKGAQIQGIRMRGPLTGIRPYRGDRQAIGRGIMTDGPGVVVSACDISYFGHGAVVARHDGVQVTRSRLHHNLQMGLGYGVVIQNGGYATITRCVFDFNRHDIAAGVGPNGYTARYCTFSRVTLGHLVDHHGPTRQSEIIVENCLFRATLTTTYQNYKFANGEIEGIYIRSGGPGGGLAGRVVIRNNVFAHTSKPPAPGVDGGAIRIAVGANSWAGANAVVEGNRYGWAGGGESANVGPGSGSGVLQRQIAEAFVAVIGAVVVLAIAAVVLGYLVYKLVR